MRVNRSLKASCYIYAGLLLSLSPIMGCERDNQAREREQRIRELVTIGAQVDEAIRILKDEGFRVGDKYHPTKARDYWQVEVPIREGFSATDSVRYTVGMGGGRKKFVVIRADTEGNVTSVD